MSVLFFTAIFFFLFYPSALLVCYLMLVYLLKTFNCIVDTVVFVVPSFSVSDCWVRFVSSLSFLTIASMQSTTVCLLHCFLLLPSLSIFWSCPFFLLYRSSEVVPSFSVFDWRVCFLSSLTFPTLASSHSLVLYIFTGFLAFYYYVCFYSYTQLVHCQQSLASALYFYRFFKVVLYNSS